MSENVIEIQNLSRQFGTKTALDCVSMAVPRGGVFGLVGENGAGKTTLIKHVLGLLRAKQGRVRVFGADPVADPPAVLGRIGYLSEDRDLPDWMRVGELIRYMQAFYPKWDEAYAEQLRAMFGLDRAAKVKQLSRGQRAQIGLLVALAHRPDLLLLDEPSSGLDPVVRRDILSAIIRTVADEGRTVLFSSHLLDEVERVVDRVAMIHGGKLVLCDEMDAIRANHHRLTLRWDVAQERPPSLPGQLSCEGSGQEWTIVCNGGLAAVKESAAALGARVVDEESASLDEIFVAHVRG